MGVRVARRSASCELFVAELVRVQLVQLVQVVVEETELWRVQRQSNWERPSVYDLALRILWEV